MFGGVARSPIAVFVHTMLRLFSAAALALVYSCSDDVNISGSDTGAEQDSGVADSGLFDSGADDAGENSAGCIATGMACPTFELASEDATCSLDLTGGTDLVQDARLEFGAGPDHAILFIAPSAGEYSFWLSQGPGNGGCGVSVYDSSQSLHSPSSCPAEGETADLDGIYAGENDPISLSANQRVLAYIGCAFWSSTQAGPYVLRVQKQ